MRTDPILDRRGRPLQSLRVSVTDRCNLRCAYCMPRDAYRWLERDEVLSLEEISTLVDALMPLGLRKVRLTGGEPLVRRGLPALIALLAAKGLDDLALTTNGVLLAEQAEALVGAGLRRATVSLDTLHADRFHAMTRRDHHARVLAGLVTARRAGLELKLDTVLVRGVNDDELVPLLDFARELGAELRFIEYMDVGGATGWSMEKVISRSELLARLGAKLGPVRTFGPRGTAPAERFQLPDGRIFGIVASTTQPFCGSCDRARLTADGRLFTCLYGTDGLPLRDALREGRDVRALVERAWGRRDDRGAEQRAGLAVRGPSSSPAGLLENPYLEMHTRGG